MEDASGDIRRLDYVYRFSSIPVVMKEQVSTHSYWVALYAAMIHDEINGPENLKPYILSHALVHDAPEARSGDFVRTFKYSSKELKDAIDKGEQEMMNSMPYRIRRLFDLPEHLFASEKIYIGMVIKAADFLSLKQFMVREVDKGNKEIEQFYHRMTNDLALEAEKIGRMKFDIESFNQYVSPIAALYERMVHAIHPSFTV
jgi:5'-deoxynucleotidase YfbR-like HD superfamily hydrolase